MNFFANGTTHTTVATLQDQKEENQAQQAAVKGHAHIHVGDVVKQRSPYHLVFGPDQPPLRKVTYGLVYEKGAVVSGRARKQAHVGNHEPERSVHHKLQAKKAEYQGAPHHLHLKAKMPEEKS